MEREADATDGRTSYFSKGIADDPSTTGVHEGVPGQFWPVVTGRGEIPTRSDASINELGIEQRRHLLLREEMMLQGRTLRRQSALARNT